ncbi:MAG: phosphoglycerate kinase [Spirochaetaceae bacterium]|nr:phosphoglycerate kinase [Spirochaetaceae bacterium]
MAVKSVKDIDLTNKKVLIRVDFNVPVIDGKITDATRITASIPTIDYILKQKGTTVILMSHLGRPKGGEKKPEFSLSIVANKLSEILGKKVIMASDCIGDAVEKLVKESKPGDIILLENVRYYKEEEGNDPEFAKKLAKLGDAYINDAFGTAHRAHASTEGVAKYLPSAAGLLIEKEVKFLEPILKNPKKPFVAVIGGAKVSSKIAVLESLLKTCDAMVIGGGMSYTFLKAMGKKIGKSLLEEDYIDTAKKFIKAAADKKVEIIFPLDRVCAKEFSENAEPIYIENNEIPDELTGMDIGPKSIEAIKKCLATAQTIVWNGPMGVFEFKNFQKGTIAVAEMVANSKAITVIGGGDSVSAINEFGYADKVSHVSTGGGASLEYLEGKPLPGIVALEK